MKATVIYADWEAAGRDTRLDVFGQGKVLDGQPELYRKVHTYEYVNGPVGPISACEEVFSLFNMPGGLQEKKKVRSMSVGDIARFRSPRCSAGLGFSSTSAVGKGASGSRFA